jgi:twitching motility protein PilI
MEDAGLTQRQDTASDWMAPVAALARFEPPEGMHLAAVGVEARQDKVVRYGFRVGTLGLLIPPGMGSEALEMSQATPLPGAPPGFLGLINLRGDLVPLYELRTLLHLGQRGSGVQPMVLVFDQGESAVGMVIEGFPVALSALKPLPSLPPLPDALLDHVLAGHEQDEMIWLEFDHRSFFDEACRGIRLGTA